MCQIMILLKVVSLAEWITLIHASETIYHILTIRIRNYCSEISLIVQYFNSTINKYID